MIASPIAASAAATVKINKVNICPLKSFKKIEKETRLILTATNKSYMDIKITIKFFLFRKIPITPIVKIIAPKIK